jgi:hypothetical protein
MAMVTMKKLYFAIFVVAFSLLGFGTLSISSAVISKAQGTLVREYGFPFPWLVVQKQLAKPGERLQSGEWWVPDSTSFVLGFFVCDLGTVFLLGILMIILGRNISKLRFHRSPSSPCRSQERSGSRLKRINK